MGLAQTHTPRAQLRVDAPKVYVAVPLCKGLPTLSVLNP